MGANYLMYACHSGDLQYIYNNIKYYSQSDVIPILIKFKYYNCLKFILSYFRIKHLYKDIMDDLLNIIDCIDTEYEEFNLELSKYKQ